MTPELTQKLHEKYPLIFADKPHLYCGEGWFWILDLLCREIQSHVDHNQRAFAQAENFNRTVETPNGKFVVPPLFCPQVVARQIKEKFGALSFYTEGGDLYVNGLVVMASAVSLRTCESCGDAGQLRRTTSHIQTLCDEHEQEKFSVS